MKGGLIAIAHKPGGACAALVVDGRLEDLLIDPVDEGPRDEDIHLARVERGAPGQGAAFVALGDGEKGYLREAKGLRPGDRLIVQVKGYTEPGKPVAVTAKRLHRGRFAILTPDAPGVNVARSVKGGEARARLAEIGEQGMAGAQAGLILRSAAMDADEAEILQEIGTLRAAEAALEGASGDPTRLARGPGAEARALRDWEAEEIAGAEAFESLDIWGALDALKDIEAPLPGGGWMAVEPTAALVAVDVNTGGDLSPKAAQTANLAAAADLPRALRLRGLGGQIVVDFAPMRKSDRKAVESALRKSLARDPVQTTLIGWTPLGHLELTRRRERRPTVPDLPQ